MANNAQTLLKKMFVQIVKILNSYTPIDDFEKRVGSSFVRKVQVSSSCVRRGFSDAFVMICPSATLALNRILHCESSLARRRCSKIVKGPRS